MEKLYKIKLTHMSRDILIHLLNDELTKEEEKFTLNHLEMCSKCNNEISNIINKIEDDATPSLVRNYTLETELEEYFSKKESSIEVVDEFFEKVDNINTSLQSYITINLYRKVLYAKIGLKKGIEEDNEKDGEKVEKKINPDYKFELVIDSDKEGYMILLLEADNETLLLCPSFFIPDDKIHKGENRYPKGENKYYLEFEQSDNPEHKLIAYITSERINLDFITNPDMSEYYALSPDEITMLNNEAEEMRKSGCYIDVFEKVYTLINK